MGPTPAARRGERGALAGGEALPLGFLLLVVAILVITNGWAVLDARLAASAASREATRTAVEAPADPRHAGVVAGQAALTSFGYGRGDSEVIIDAPDGFGRCAPVIASVTQVIPAVRVPWIGGIGEVTVTAHHREVVDPFRNGVPEGSC